MDIQRIQLLEKEVVYIARKAGCFIKNEKKNFSWKDVQYKGRNNLVSYVDVRSEEMIVEHLMHILPDAGILGEESRGNRQGEWLWVIDPLDGTTNFVHGLPMYSVSIALVKGNECYLGIVFDPERDECFSAIRGMGAYLNGQRLQASMAASMEQALIGTGFPTRNFSRRKEYLRTLHDLMENSHGIRLMGSAALDLCYVAAGRLDAFFEYNLSPWDVAAGALCCLESGCRISDFSGKGEWLYGKEIIAAPEPLFDEFCRFIKKNFSNE